MLLVGHDAQLNGAQVIIFHVADTLKNQFGCEVACLYSAAARWCEEYARRMHVMKKALPTSRGWEAEASGRSSG